MSDAIYIGIDSGTQGVKVVALSAGSGEVLAEGRAPHALIENNEGRREQKPDWWVVAVESALTEVLAAPGVDPKHIAALGVSGQQHGMVPLDAKGRVIRPAKLWCDTETAPQCATITKRLGGEDKVVERIGNAVAAGFTASKILWLKENEPENYARLDTVLLPHDYLNYWLTGEKKTECGDASGTAYFDVRAREWSLPVLSAIDESGRLEGCLPMLVESHEPVGVVRPEIAARFGLPANVLVSSGGGDNMMAAIGTGNAAPGMVTASFGTSGTIFAFSETPVIDPRGELAAFCSSSGGWLPLVCTMNVTVSTELTRQLLDIDIKKFNALAAAAPLGADGVLLLPYFNGERTPALPGGKAAFSGLTSANLNRENLCRAAMEGATLGLRYGLDVMRRLGVAPKEIRLVGGGAKSALWREIAANVFDCPVVCPVQTEAGALGAALQAMWAHARSEGGKESLKDLCDRYIRLDAKSRVEPDPKKALRYGQVYRNYLELNGALKPLFSM
jgi:xylulokinase